MNRIIQRMIIEELGFSRFDSMDSPEDVKDCLVDVILGDGTIIHDVDEGIINWWDKSTNSKVSYYRLAGAGPDLIDYDYITDVAENVYTSEELDESKEDIDFHGDFSSMSPEERDKVINPKHYKILPPEVMQEYLHTGMEYMDIMKYVLAHHKGVVAHVLGQVFKYAFRLGNKDEPLQDATKIAWYGNRLVEEIEHQNKGK